VEGHENKIELLLEKGANMNSLDVQLRDTMHHAVNSANCTPSLVNLQVAGEYCGDGVPVPDGE
jgi:hypothetical protein